VDARTLLFIAAGFGLVVAVLITALTISSRFGGTINLAAEQPHRPWWGNPVVWLLVGAAFTVVGLFVFPKIFGFAFLFLPLIWISRFGKRRWNPDDANRRPPDDQPMGS
jgi:hypothetical protein